MLTPAYRPLTRRGKLEAARVLIFTLTNENSLPDAFLDIWLDTQVGLWFLPCSHSIPRETDVQALALLRALYAHEAAYEDVTRLGHEFEFQLRRGGVSFANLEFQITRKLQRLFLRLTPISAWRLHSFALPADVLPGLASCITLH